VAIAFFLAPLLLLVLMGGEPSSKRLLSGKKYRPPRSAMGQDLKTIGARLNSG